jgi:hypothetical protein
MINPARSEREAFRSLLYFAVIIAAIVAVVLLVRAFA